MQIEESTFEEAFAELEEGLALHRRGGHWLLAAAANWMRPS